MLLYFCESLDLDICTRDSFMNEMIHWFQYRIIIRNQA